MFNNDDVMASCGVASKGSGVTLPEACGMGGKEIASREGEVV